MTLPAADEPTPIGDTPARRSATGALFVSIGIFATKMFGIVRQVVIAHFLGASVVADAFNAAFRIPNLLQNLFGEGALSAAFIPVYSNLLARGSKGDTDATEEAGRVAGAVLAILALLVSILVLLGVLFTPQILPLIAAGFKGRKRALAITYVRILFPGAGLFVMSAWCLGVLNSHRKFLLSYAAPVVWNLAIILALLVLGKGENLTTLGRTAAWASVVGAGAQFLVQVPFVLRLAPQLRISLDFARQSVRTVLRNFGPVGVSRGVVQLSAFIDQLISSFLPDGMVSLLFYATTISYVPVSMFGIAISAAELPEMSSVIGDASERARQIRERLNAGLRQIAYFVVPSAVAMLAVGDVMAAALFQNGRFTHQDTIYTWGILAGSSVGLLASTLGRLYSSTYYALHDTKTPLLFAGVRVLLTSALGYVFAIPLPRALGIDSHWGAAGLTVSFGLAGWVEFTLLRRGMNKRIGVTGLPVPYTARLWGSAALAGVAAFGIKLLLGHMNRVVTGIVVLGAFGLTYLGVTSVLRVPETQILVNRLRHKR
jgi:putative peptidoglycan lipid II flippase